ncbi:MAG: hypothetical protein Ct9H90mP22_8550 [Gammaproteobacteria bacterium]|nr:MAG: hypothetical protein Ct9H90mP22_8550 [Gammaproteobacteria bacterium]
MEIGAEVIAASGKIWEKGFKAIKGSIFSLEVSENVFF